MILIADSGSTKTDWCLAENGKSLLKMKTQGINPYMQDGDVIEKIIVDELLPQIGDAILTDIYFYGAGCTPEKIGIVGSALKMAFPDAEISVGSDMLGAARALCGHRAGIACILGTGSNSCLYDGTMIIENTPSLGFILGDEGSGAYIGKRFIGDCLKKQIPENLCEEFLIKYELNANIIINKVYRTPLPNRFLASICPFISEHKDVKEVHDLLIDSFHQFLHRNVSHYNKPKNKINFIGSIAHYFREEIEEAARAEGMAIGKIMQSPIKGLLEFHK